MINQFRLLVNVFHPTSAFILNMFEDFSSKNFKGQKALDFDKFSLTNCHSMYQFLICTSQVLLLYLAQHFLNKKKLFFHFIQATTFLFRDLVNAMVLAFSGCLQFTKSKQYISSKNVSRCQYFCATFFLLTLMSEKHPIHIFIYLMIKPQKMITVIR